MITVALLIPRVIVMTALVVGLAAHLSGPVAQRTPSRPRLNVGRIGLTCQVASRHPAEVGANLPPVATGGRGQLQVTVPPLVFATVASGVMRITTNTGYPPATTDGFYLLSGGRAIHATAPLVETIMRRCG